MSQKRKECNKGKKLDYTNNLFIIHLEIKYKVFFIFFHYKILFSFVYMLTHHFGPEYSMVAGWLTVTFFLSFSKTGAVILKNKMKRVFSSILEKFSESELWHPPYFGTDG